MSNIIVGVSGGIAAYKTCELVRLLKKAGHAVQVVMTENARSFITAETLAALSANPVYGEAFTTAADPMLHITLARWADKVIIAPAAATTLSLLAQGSASTLLTCVCLATRAPCYLVPSMNQAMWYHSATQANIASLNDYGYMLLQPGTGDQACGDNGPGCMPEPPVMMEWLFQDSGENCFAGTRVVITAGPTYEKLDPIRYLGNVSSGKMGYALARALVQQGAEVEIISGPTSLAAPAGCQLTPITSARQMYNAAVASAPAADIFISAAAVANYSPSQATEKIKSDADELVIRLARTTDILQALTQQYPHLFSVGFCAESTDIVEAARAKLARKGCQVMVANEIGPNAFPFGQNVNRALYLNSQGITYFTDMSKQELAHQLVSCFYTDFMAYRAGSQ